ncbi:MAG: YfiR family protein [Candidatus Poribacteria bacterium]|nr:YfiR family protein [Candidatus Poribacteria bacterium]
MMKRTQHIARGVMIVWMMFVVANAVAQMMVVPERTQYALFQKILTFERSLAKRDDKEFVVGFLYQSRVRESLNARDAFERVAENDKSVRLFGKPVRFRFVDLQDVDKLEESLLEGKPHILYVAPLRAIEIKRISKITRKNKVLTLTGVPEYVENGLSVGIGLQSENKPEILVNITAAKAEGADFHSELLKLSRIYR